MSSQIKKENHFDFFDSPKYLLVTSMDVEDFTLKVNGLIDYSPLGGVSTSVVHSPFGVPSGIRYSQAVVKKEVK